MNGSGKMVYENLKRAGFQPARQFVKKLKFNIFSGGMYVGKNRLTPPAAP